jgi:mediator of RNA polymerase II transcription subunit 18, fungi type
MQQFALYSQIPATRQDQVLQILAGVTAAHPTKVFEEHLVYEQLQLPPATKKSQNQANQRRTYQQLIRSPSDGLRWTHRTTDVPEPGVKHIISQPVLETTLADTDFSRFRPDSRWFKFTRQYYVKGDRFVQGNVVITVTRVCQGDVSSEDPLDRKPMMADELRPVDPSGAYVVEAYVRVEEGSSTALRDQATKELLAFAETLKGAVNLRVPDRLALDPRLRG